MDVGTRHLHAFHTVYRCGSVSQASQILHRAQSAITRSIQELERELQAPLFERHGRGMLPTDFGRALAQRVERAFACMDAVRQELSRATGEPGTRHAAIYRLQMAKRRLQMLVELAARQHMGTVAEALGVSQPAISHTLHEVEEDLGAPLFTRSVRGLTLTPVGEMLLRQLRLALNEVRIAGDEIAAMKGLIRGQIRVGTLSLGRTYLLPVAIVRMQRQYPQLTVSTMEGPFETLTSALRAGEIDFILGALRPPAHTQGLVAEALMNDTMAIVTRIGHPLLKLKTLSFDHLRDAKWVLPEPGTPTRELLVAALAAHDLGKPCAAIETADLSIMREVLLESDLITAISPHQFYHELTNGLLACLSLPLPETARRIGILRRTEDHPSPGASLLIEAIRALPDLSDVAASLLAKRKAPAKRR